MYLVMLRASAPRYCSRDALSPRLLEVEIRLQAHPVARRIAEVLRETQRRVGRDAPLAEDDLVDATRRHADFTRQGILAEPAGLEKLLVKNLAGVEAALFFHLIPEPRI